MAEPNCRCELLREDRTGIFPSPCEAAEMLALHFENGVGIGILPGKHRLWERPNVIRVSWRTFKSVGADVMRKFHLDSVEMGACISAAMEGAFSETAQLTVAEWRCNEV